MSKELSNHYFLPERMAIKAMIIIITTTIKIPKPIPALKIPAMALQELACKENNISANAVSILECFIIKCFIK